MGSTVNDHEKRIGTINKNIEIRSNTKLNSPDKSESNVTERKTLNYKFYTIPVGEYFSGKGKFRGAVSVGNQIYFTPFNSTKIGILSTESKEFSTVDIIDHVMGELKFWDSVVVKNKIYFV